MVQCPACGVEVSEWAPQCDGCKTALPNRLGPPAPDPTFEVPAPKPLLEMTADFGSPPAADSPVEPMPKPTQSRPPSRPVVLVAAVVVVLLAVAAFGHRDAPKATKPPGTAHPTTTPAQLAVPPSTADTPTTPPTTTPPPPLFDHRTGTTLVMAGGSGLTDLDLDHNSTRVFSLPLTVFPANSGPIIPLPLRRGGTIVYQDGLHTFAIPGDLSRPPTALGASVTFVPSVRPDRVWLANIRPRTASIEEVDMAGRVTSPPVTLPVDWTPFAAISNGLLLTSGTGPTFEIWDQGSGRVVRPGPPGAQLMASNDRSYAWTSTGCQTLCAIHVTDVVSGTDQAFYPPVGGLQWYGFAGFGFGSLAAFSPDGRHLAVALPTNSPGPAGPLDALLVVDIATGSSLVVPGSGSGSMVAWAPSGQWVFLMSIDQGASNIKAYQLGAARAEPVNIPPNVNATMAALLAF